MLRRMCKKCAKYNWEYYFQRELSGEVVNIKKTTSTITKTLQCSNCGHQWSYSRKR